MKRQTNVYLFLDIKNKIYLKDEIDRLYQKVIEFLENNKEQSIILNGYNSFIEIKLNLCDDNNDILMNIKFNSKDSSCLSEAEFNIKIERCLLKLFANDILELNQADFGYEIYLNSLHTE